MTLSRPIAPRRCSLLPLLVCLGANAQTAAPGPDCTAIADDAQRLACYDQRHGRRAAPAAIPGAPPAPEPPTAPTPPAPPVAAAPAIAPGLSAGWDLDDRRRALFAPRPHRPVYLLPVTWTSRINRNPSSPAPGHQLPIDTPLALQATEAKYQLSLKSKLAHDIVDLPISVWAAYTQSSRWQVYNGDLSRPFRETNYEPELIFATPLRGQIAGWQLRMASLSLNHQSNGRSLPLSRSWNRVIGEIALERGEWTLQLRPWWRVPESAGNDDNPDLVEQIGRGEIRLARHWGEHALALQLRSSGRRSNVQIDWAFPLTGVLHGYLQISSGRGESLIDYNWPQQRIGLGVSIAGWR